MDDDSCGRRINKSGFNDTILKFSAYSLPTCETPYKCLIQSIQIET